MQRKVLTYVQSMIESENGLAGTAAYRWYTHQVRDGNLMNKVFIIYFNSGSYHSSTHQRGKLRIINMELLNDGSLQRPVNPHFFSSRGLKRN